MKIRVMKMTVKNDNNCNKDDNAKSYDNNNAKDTVWCLQIKSLTSYLAMYVPDEINHSRYSSIAALPSTTPVTQEPWPPPCQPGVSSSFSKGTGCCARNVPGHLATTASSTL